MVVDSVSNAHATPEREQPYEALGLKTNEYDDIRALLEPRASKLEGAIAGRALYDGRLDAAEALKLIREARA